MDVDALNPFVNKGQPPYFMGGRRQELLQYISHLGSNLYDVVFLSGAEGVGKTVMLRLLASHMLKRRVQVTEIDARLYTTFDLVNELCQGLQSQLRVENSAVKVANASTVSSFKTKDETQLVQWLCVDNAQVWSEESIKRLFLLIESSRMRRLISKEKGEAKIKCVLCVDTQWMKAARNWPSFPRLDKISYAVELQSLNPAEVRKYIDYRINSVDVSPKKFAIREIDQIVRASRGVPREIDRLLEEAFHNRYCAQSKGLKLFPKIHVAAIGLLFSAVIWLWWTGLADQESQQQVVHDLEADWARAADVVRNGDVEAIDQVDDGADIDLILDLAADDDGYVAAVAEDIDDLQEIEFGDDADDLSPNVPEVISKKVIEKEMLSSSTEQIKNSAMTSVAVDLSVFPSDKLLNDKPLKHIEEATPSLPTVQAKQKDPVALMNQSQPNIDGVDGDTAEEVKAHDELLSIPSPGVSDKMAGQPTSIKKVRNQLILEKNKYTIQLLAGTDLKDIEWRQERYEKLYGQPIHRVEQQQKGAPWYILTAGQFDSRQAATEALKGMPQAIRSAQPWIRSTNGLVR